MELIKQSTMTISEVMRKKKRGMISLNHPLQRPSGQWSNIDKAGYISDILQNLPMDSLKIGEESLRGTIISWILDGVQRITIAEAFINNEFSVSSKVERYMIEYFVSVLDEDGLPTFDEDNKPVLERKEFDIRKKKFKQLPVELQETFMEFKFPTITHLNCTPERISYHLKRYNAGKPMNAVQKGFTYIGDRWGNAVRNIAAMSFFVDGIGKYSQNDFKVGNIERVIAESIMTTRYLKNYCKTFTDNAKYLEENATADDFEYFRGLAEQLAENVDETVGQMFDKKDSFLWFGLYSKFIALGLNDEQFNTFMLKLNRGMYTKDEDGKVIKGAPMRGICINEIDGTMFEDVWKNSSTKDVNIVKTRIDFLIKLACDYFGVEMIDVVEETKDETLSQENSLFVVDNEETDDVTECELVVNDENLQDFIEEFSGDYTDRNIKFAIESLMLTTKGHNLTDFKSNSLQTMVGWYENNGNEKMLNDCLSYKSFVEDAEINNDNPNMPLFIWGAKYASDKMDEDIEFDVDIADWLREFSKTAFREIESSVEYEFEDSAAIQQKKNEIIKSLREYSY